MVLKQFQYLRTITFIVAWLPASASARSLRCCAIRSLGTAADRRRDGYGCILKYNYIFVTSIHYTLSCYETTQKSVCIFNVFIVDGFVFEYR